MSQIFKTIEFIPDFNRINNMSDRQKNLWKMCENVEDWRDGVCSYKEDHPFGANEEEVKRIESIDDFMLTEITDQYLEVLCIDLIGVYIHIKLLEKIHNYCPKLECLFINITEFNENSWKYLINNIAPQLKHLSLDNSICYKSNQTINFGQLFKNCKNLEECKLVFFQFDRIESIFNYESLRNFNENLTLIYIKYHDLNQKTIYQKVIYNENTENKYTVDRQSDYTSDILELDSYFDNESIISEVEGYEGHYFPNNLDNNPGELEECLKNLKLSNARPHFLRIESRESVYKTIPALFHVSKFVFLRALNLSIKNVAKFEDNIESTDICEEYYNQIINNIKYLESLTLYFDKECDSPYLLYLFTKAELRHTLTRLRLINAVLNTNSFKQLKESFNNLKSLQLVNTDFTEEDSDLDTIVTIITNINNLDELIIEYPNEEHQDGSELLKFTGLSVIEIIKRCPRLNFVRIIGVNLTDEEEAKIQNLFNNKPEPKDLRIN